MLYQPSAQRVLLVEDDEQSRAALRFILEQEGYEVRVAKDGGEGVDLASAFQPDVIILDLVLPGLNGFDAATLLKADANTSGIPLVAVTASWLGSESRRLQQIGFEAALRKPFPATALLEELKRVLRH